MAHWQTASEVGGGGRAEGSVVPDPKPALTRCDSKPQPTVLTRRVLAGRTMEIPLQMSLSSMAFLHPLTDTQSKPPPPPPAQVLASWQGCRPTARGAPPDPEHQLHHGGECQRPHRLTGHTPRHLNPVQHPRKLRAGLRSRTLPHQHDLWVLHTLTPLSQLPSEPASYIAPCPWPRLPPYPLGTATCQTLHCGAPWPAVGLIPPPPLASLNPLSPSPCPHYSLPGHAL